MNDYRQRFEPSTTTSMGKFFANRLRDSLHFGTNERENFDQTTADFEATPEPPPLSLYDINRSIITPSSTASSRHETYFTPSTTDTHKFSRRVELSSGYNILKNRTSSRPVRLPAYLQGRTPLAQLNPLPSTTISTSDDIFQRRSSLADYNRTQQIQFDTIRRPFSSDSPLPPSLPTSTTVNYISSAPIVSTRTVYEPIEPLKLTSEQEDNSIAELSRELRAAAYPTTRKSANHSPTRETSPSTSKYSTRTNTKRHPPRSLPKLHSTEPTNIKTTHFYHHNHHESEKPPSSTIKNEDRLQSSSTASLLLDQFFNSEPISPPNNDKHERPPSSTRLLRTTSDDSSLSFVSKYARLAPIVSSSNLSNDTLHDVSSLPLTDDLLQTSDIANDDVEDNFSYVPSKEQLNSINGMPLLELDELETSSDISESQLVPIIYAKELANEIDLLQKAHLLKQQQRSMSMTTTENERLIDNNSVPIPDNMELLNFEALEEEFSIHPSRHETPTASPIMEICSPPRPPSVHENDTPLTNVLQHSILAHNRSSPWYKLPTELWFKILRHLPTNDLHNFSYVCKRFYALAQDRACQHQICFNRRLRFEALWLDSLARRQPISITFNECRQQTLEQQQQSTDQTSEQIDWREFFESIGPTLIHFTMSGCYHEPFTPSTLLPILVQTCPNLLSLNLRWNQMIESTLSHLTTYSQIIHLHTLDLTGCQILDDTMLINIFIRQDQQKFALKKLILQACTNLTWMGLDTISVCLPNLTSLNLSRCIGLKTHSPQCFHSWSKLEYLDLSYLLTLTNQDLLDIINHCHELKMLIIDECLNITDESLSRLTDRFEMLSLNNCSNLSRNFLLNLNEQCPNLHILSMNSITNLTDDCLVNWSMKPWIYLRELSIDKYTCDRLEIFLNKHSNLKLLSLNGNLISQKLEQENLERKFSNIDFVFQ